MFIHDAILEATTAGSTEVERERIGRYVDQELGEIVARNGIEEKGEEDESEEGEETQETLLEKQFRVRGFPDDVLDSFLYNSKQYHFGQYYLPKTVSTWWPIWLWTWVGLT